MLFLTSSAINHQDISDTATTQPRKLKFRNYQPKDKSLLKLTGKVPDGNDTNTTIAENQPARSNKTTTAVEPVKENIILKELENIKKEIGGDDTINIAPKKINWDLKNQVQDKIHKLKRRTQRAVVEILREKLSQAQDSDSD